MDWLCSIRRSRRNVPFKKQHDDQANAEDRGDNCAGPDDPHLTWESRDSSCYMLRFLSLKPRIRQMMKKKRGVTGFIFTVDSLCRTSQKQICVQAGERKQIQSRRCSVEDPYQCDDRRLQSRGQQDLRTSVDQKIERCFKWMRRRRKDPRLCLCTLKELMIQQSWAPSLRTTRVRFVWSPSLRLTGTESKFKDVDV